MKDINMNYIRACRIFGRGNEGYGRRIIFALADRLEHAQTKHVVFANSKNHATDVIDSELDELCRAIESGEGVIREEDEALDVAVTAIRYFRGDHEKR